MRNSMRICLPCLTILFLFLLIADSFSQGLNSGTYLDRARGAAAGNPAPATPPPGVSPEEFARFQAGNNVLSGQTSQGAAPAPEIRMITVVEGELVISAK